MTPARSLPRWLLAMLLLLPAVPYLWVIPHAGRLQYNDYYAILAQIAGPDGRFVTEPLRWLLVKSNEHTVAVAAGIYALNVALTRGDNRALSLWAVLMMVLTAAALWRMVPEGLRRGRRWGPAVALAVGAMACTPVAAHNVVMGFSGTLWLTANALAMGAVAVLWNGGREAGPGRVAAAAGLALTAALTYSTGLAAWAALGVVAAAGRLPRRAWAILAVPAVANLLFEAVTYVRPAELPPPGTCGPLGLVRYLAAYLGQLYGLGWPSAVVGLAGLAAAASLGVTAMRAPREVRAPLIPWLGVGTYALLNALATAVARGRLAGARSSRYATLAGLFWVVLLVAAAWLVASHRRKAVRRRLGAAWGVTVVALLVAMAVCGAGLVERYLLLAAGQPLAELAWVHGVDDEEALRVLTPRPEQLRLVRPGLVAMGHVPFDRPPWVEPGSLPPGGVAGACPAGWRVRGVASPLPGGVLRLDGTAAGTGPCRLLLVGPDGRVAGAGVPLPPRWPGRAGRPAGGRWPWAGYVAGSSSGEVEVLLEVKGRWCRVGEVRLSRGGG